jgi:hypothetical protein
MELIIFVKVEIDLFVKVRVAEIELEWLVETET